MLVNTGVTIHNGRHRVDQTLMAMQEMERYCAAHPNTPVSLRHPRLFIRGRTFVALLGPSIEEGITGFGDSVQAALRAFDRQYSRSLTPSQMESFRKDCFLRLPEIERRLPLDCQQDVASLPMSRNDSPKNRAQLVKI